MLKRLIGESRAFKEARIQIEVAIKYYHFHTKTDVQNDQHEARGYVALAHRVYKEYAKGHPTQYRRQEILKRRLEEGFLP